MAKKTIKAQMKQRRDTKANWEATNPVLLDGELGIVSDDPNLYKVGDGATAWNHLPFRGFDGTLAQELGTSPNAVISQKVVSEKLTELESEIIEITGGDKVIPCERNIGMLRANGTIFVSPSTAYEYRFTQFIPVSAGKKYRVKGFQSSDANAVVCGYQTSEESSFVAGAIQYDYHDTEAAVVEFICPQNVNFICIGYNILYVSDEESVCWEICESILKKDQVQGKLPCIWHNGYVTIDGYVSGHNQSYSSFIPLEVDKKYKYIGSQGDTGRLICALYKTSDFSSLVRVVADAPGDKVEGEFICPKGANYAVVGRCDPLSENVAGLYEIEEAIVKDASDSHDCEKIGIIRRPLIGFIFDGSYDMNESLVDVIYQHGYHVGIAPAYDNIYGNNRQCLLPLFHKWMAQGHEILIHGSVDLGNTSTLSIQEAEDFIKEAKRICNLYGFLGKGYVALKGACQDKYIPLIKKYFDYAATESNRSGVEKPYLEFADKPYKLWRYSLQGSTLEQMKNAVDVTIENNGLLLFYTHATSADIGFSTIANVGTLCDYIEQKEADSLVTVKTPYECVLDYYNVRYEDI